MIADSFFDGASAVARFSRIMAFWLGVKGGKDRVMSRQEI